MSCKSYRESISGPQPKPQEVKAENKYDPHNPTETLYVFHDGHFIDFRRSIVRYTPLDIIKMFGLVVGYVVALIIMSLLVDLFYMVFIILFSSLIAVVGFLWMLFSMKFKYGRMYKMYRDVNKDTDLRPDYNALAEIKHKMNVVRLQCRTGLNWMWSFVHPDIYVSIEHLSQLNNMSVMAFGSDSSVVLQRIQNFMRSTQNVNVDRREMIYQQYILQATAGFALEYYKDMSYRLVESADFQ
jgi:hypothetical protein